MNDGVPTVRPKFTIAIPVYNCETYLRFAIESALNQTMPPAAFEIVVLDNCSTDHSYSIAKSYGPRVVAQRHKENLGVIRNFNECFRQASGNNVVILHADDMLDTRYLEFVEDILERCPDVDVVLTKSLHVDGAGRIVGEARPLPKEVGVLDNALTDLALSRYGASPSWTTRRRFYQRYGGFDEALKFAPDHDFIMKAAANSRLYYTPTPLVYYRIHGANNGIWQHKLGFDIEDGVVLFDRYLPMLPCGRLIRLRAVYRGLLIGLWGTMKYGLQGDLATMEARRQKLLDHPYQSTVTRCLCKIVIALCRSRQFGPLLRWAFLGSRVSVAARRAVERVL